MSSSDHKLPPPSLLHFEGWRRIFNPFISRASGATGPPRSRIRWARLAAAVAGIGMLSYVVLTSAVFIFARFAQRVDGVGYVDILLPSRWDRYRVARGDHHIAMAEKLAASGKRLEALLLVRTGVARSPANRAGRLLLAQLLVEAGRADTARQVLLDGIQFHYADPEFIKPLCTFLLRQQQDAAVIALARKYLVAPVAPTEANRLLALAAATASFFRGNYDAADDFLHSVPLLSQSRDGRLLEAKIENDRGYRDLALLRLGELAAEFPDDTEVHTELATRLDRAGQTDDARRLALAFQIAHPTLPGPRLDLLRAYRATGEHERAAREIDTFIRDFASDPAALFALADFAANAGDAALAHRLQGHAVAQKTPAEAHAILAVEALVVARDFHGAIATGQTLLQQNPTWTTTYAPVVNSLLAIAHFGLGDTETARLFLTSYLNRSDLRAENLLAIAQRLVDVDAVNDACIALARAIAADPLNQAALTRLVELDLNLNRIDELPPHLTRLLAMRRPSPDILRVAQHKLGSDLFLFSSARPAALESVRLALEKNPGGDPRH